MAWTTPRTWVAAETVTAALLNTHLRDNLNALYAVPRASVYRAADEPLTDSTWELNNWTAEEYDTDGFHDNATNNGRLTAPIDGLYDIRFKLNFSADADGLRRVNLRMNSGASEVGGTSLGVWTNGSVGSSIPTTVAGARHVPLVATDYVETFVWHNGGTGISIESGTSTSFLQMAWVGN